jgi:hypothetical protein
MLLKYLKYAELSTGYSQAMYLKTEQFLEFRRELKQIMEEFEKNEFTKRCFLNQLDNLVYKYKQMLFESVSDASEARKTGNGCKTNKK